MRLIDADVLMEILTTAIRNMKGVAKFLDAEDDPEIQLEIKAYTDIANGIKDMPTIEPERTGKWIYGESECGNDGYYCDKCGNFVPWKYGEYDIDFIKEFLFCNKCGARMKNQEGRE